MPVPEDAPTVDAPRAARGRALGMTWRFLIVIVVVAALALTLVQSLRVYFAQAAEIAALRVEIENKRNEIAELEDQLARWDDPAYVKAEARERLGWVMPGEVGYRVIGVDGQPLGGDSAVLAPEEPPPGNWWQKAWGSVAVADKPVAEPTEPTIPTAPPTTIGPTPSPSPSATN